MIIGLVLLGGAVAGALVLTRDPGGGAIIQTPGAPRCRAGPGTPRHPGGPDNTTVRGGPGGAPAPPATDAQASG